MKRALAACLLLTGSVSRAAEPEWQRDLLGAVVQIELLDAAGGSASCGVGTIIAPGVLVSALHLLDETLAPGGFRLQRLEGGAAAVVRLDQAGVDLVKGDAQQQAHDVAFLRFPRDLLETRVAPAAWLSEGALREKLSGAIVSYHAGACLPAGESIPAGDTWRSLTLEPSRQVVLASGHRVTAMALSREERAGYSGSPVLSSSHRSVVGVYIAGRVGRGGAEEGYATSLADVQVLWREAVHEELPEGWIVPRSLAVAVTVAPLERGFDPTVRGGFPEAALEGRAYAVELIDDLVWWTPGARVAFESRTRSRVVAAYPGTAPTTRDVDEELLALAPLLGARGEVGRLAATVEPGFSWHRVFWSPDAQWYFAWEPSLALSLRVSPWRANAQATRVFRLGLQGTVSLYTRATAPNYHFDLAGAPRDIASPLNESPWWLKVLAEVTF
jgi:hypothetical protein